MTVRELASRIPLDPRIDQESRDGEVLDGRYRVLGRIGVGGMGVVHEGEHVHIGRRVAIKFVRRNLAVNPSMLEQFRFEARAAGQIVSDYVAAVLDFGVAPDGSPYLVMEKLRGETVAQRLARRGWLSVDESVRIVAQACRGVQAAHDIEIAHCDLKPSNLLLAIRDDSSEVVKLLDFGVARLLMQVNEPSSSGTSRVMGTPRYMAPEQASGRVSVDARTDVYALGVILYQLLCGELPHGGGDPITVRCRLLREEPISILARKSSVPVQLADIVHRALARAPSQRYATARAFAEALEAFAFRRARARRAATDSLPETQFDPPTQVELTRTLGSMFRSVVTFSPVVMRQSAQRQLPLGWPRFGGIALVGILLALTIVGVRMFPPFRPTVSATGTSSSRLSHEATGSMQTPSVPPLSAASTPTQTPAEGHKGKPVVAEVSAPIPSGIPHRGTRRTGKQQREVPSRNVNPSREVAPPPSRLSQPSSPSRNYEEDVGF